MGRFTLLARDRPTFGLMTARGALVIATLAFLLAYSQA